MMLHMSDALFNCESALFAEQAPLTYSFYMLLELFWSMKRTQKTICREFYASTESLIFSTRWNSRKVKQKYETIIFKWFWVLFLSITNDFFQHDLNIILERQLTVKFY